MSKQNKEALRTNHSDDDLICKEKIEPIILHKSDPNIKSIMKPTKRIYSQKHNVNMNPNSSSNLNVSNTNDSKVDK